MGRQLCSIWTTTCRSPTTINGRRERSDGGAVSSLQFGARIRRVIKSEKRGPDDSEYLLCRAQDDSDVPNSSGRVIRLRDEIRSSDSLLFFPCPQIAACPTQSLASDDRCHPMMARGSLPNGSVEFLNQRWHDYTGLSPQEAHGPPRPALPVAADMDTRSNLDSLVRF